MQNIVINKQKLCLMTNQPGLIVVSVVRPNIYGHKTIGRLPNDLLWCVNSLLFKKFKLYEYFTSSKQSTPNTIKSEYGLWRRKYLCFREIDSTYMRPICFSSEEEMQMRSMYDDFDLNHDLYTMEQICELSYIAVDDIDIFVNMIRAKGIARQRKQFLFIEDVAPVCVRIEDHEKMTIRTSNLEVNEEIIKVIQSIGNKG